MPRGGAGHGVRGSRIASVEVDGRENDLQQFVTVRLSVTGTRTCPYTCDVTCRGPTPQSAFTEAG